MSDPTRPRTAPATAILDGFVEQARAAFADDLVSVVLFGSKPVTALGIPREAGLPTTARTYMQRHDS